MTSQKLKEFEFMEANALPFCCKHVYIFTLLLILGTRLVISVYKAVLTQIHMVTETAG